MGLKNVLNDFWPRFLGKLFAVWAVRRWGGVGSVWPGQPQLNSPFAGRSWTAMNYVVGYVAVWGAASLLKRGGKGRFATQFYHGGVDALLTKAVWTEGFARSTFLQQQFGNTPRAWHALSGAPAEGSIQRTDDGSTWIWMDGAWQSMQGLETAGPLDGLETAGPLDGMGHALPEATSAREQMIAAYDQSGYVSPYQAAYT